MAQVVHGSPVGHSRPACAKMRALAPDIGSRVRGRPSWSATSSTVSWRGLVSKEWRPSGTRREGLRPTAPSQERRGILSRVSWSRLACPAWPGGQALWTIREGCRPEPFAVRACGEYGRVNGSRSATRDTGWRCTRACPDVRPCQEKVHGWSGDAPFACSRAQQRRSDGCNRRRVRIRTRGPRATDRRPRPRRNRGMGPRGQDLHAPDCRFSWLAWLRVPILDLNTRPVRRPTESRGTATRRKE